jgi:hypothetical protein
MSSPSALADLFNESSTPYRDPLARVDFDGIDRDCWWLPPAALSLAGVPAFESLPPVVRRRLSHFEFAWLVETAMWVEALFIEKMGAALDRPGAAEHRLRYLHEIREEAGHSLMFLELMRRSGVGVPDAARHRPRLACIARRLSDVDGALFWVLAVIGEELPDKLSRMVRQGHGDDPVSPLICQLATLHVIDEARHIPYSRANCVQRSAALGNARRRLLAPLVTRLLLRFARFVFYPPKSVYALARLPRSTNWTALARSNPARAALMARALYPTAEFLRDAGWQLPQ